jgi:hypothetical protein
MGFSGAIRRRGKSGEIDAGRVNSSTTPSSVGAVLSHLI